jgi:hypothetical protein
VAAAGRFSAIILLRTTMADDSVGLITPEMRAYVGKESDPWVCEVDRTAVRMFARAVGHTDPVYYDVDAARTAGYSDLPAPPGYLGTPVFDPASGDPMLRGQNAAPQPSRPLTRSLAGGSEIEYSGDICAGDVLTARSHIAGYQERAASLGPMLISTTRTLFTNQHGKVVAVSTRTGIRY